MSNLTPVSAASRFAGTIVVLLGYALGFACLVLGWLGSYPALPSFPISGGFAIELPALSTTQVLVLCIVGLFVIHLSRQHANAVGSSPGQLLTILAIGALGFSVWSLALFEPSWVFPTPISPGMKLGAFLIGWMALMAAVRSARLMNGYQVKEDDDA